MKKLLLSTLVAMMLFSTSVSAVHQRVSNAYQFNGHWVYAVWIYNDRPEPIYCWLRGSNGAYYSGFVQANSWSWKMRINDLNATFKWECQ